MMTSLKRWHLLPLAAFLFMSIVPTVTKVVNSMSDCDEFLLDGTPPQIPGILRGRSVVNLERYKPICQTYKDKRRFVTLYDTNNKIPVFSAYKYRGGQNIEKVRRPPWRIEIQLEERNTNMWNGKFQAIDNDYKIDEKFRVYNRGHLFPNAYAFDLNEQTSTFTLTNIVPQAESFKSGSWKKMETCTKCILDKYCINSNDAKEAFLVTGAQPSKDNKLNNRVNIPSMLWSAFCCYSKNENKWLASAHWGDNVNETESKYLQTKTLAELHQKLSTENSRFELFPGSQCPLDTTVAEFYTEIDKTCQCPPQAPTTTAPPTTTTSLPTTTASPSSTTIPTTTATTISPTTTVPTTTSTTRATTTTTTKKKDSNSENDDGGQGEEEDGSGTDGHSVSGGGPTVPIIILPGVTKRPRICEIKIIHFENDPKRYEWRCDCY